MNTPVFDNGVKMTRTGLSLPDDLTEIDWEEFGRKLGNVETSYQWMVGDWWVFGNSKYGDRAHIVKSPTWTGPAFGTCANCGWVCRAFQASLRREALTFKHHQKITALQAAKPQLAEEILDWCEEPLKAGKNKPRSVSSMRKEIRKRLDKHFEPLQRSKSTTKEDFDYIEFIGPISRFAEHKPFDIKEIARVQLDLFGKPELLSEDINDCQKVVKLINEFLKAVRPEHDQSPVHCCPKCG